MPTSQEEIDLSQQQELAARAAAQAEVTSQKDKATIEALEKRIEEIDREKLRLLTENKFLKEQLVKVKEGREVYEYGLSRGNLLDREWHKKNPRAAKHFFGFKDWKDTVVMLHCLFDVLPPMKIPSKATPISTFEKYLMAYMRIHTGMTVYIISLIWGRHDTHVSKLIGKTIPIIGNAGTLVRVQYFVT